MDEQGEPEVRHVTENRDRFMEVDAEVGRWKGLETKEEIETLATEDRQGRVLASGGPEGKAKVTEVEIKEPLAACAQIEREQEAERLRAIVAGLVRTGSKHPQVEALARTFHEIYERLAPGFEYETREASAKPWGEVPEKNRGLMIATCAELLARGVVVWNGGVPGTWKAADLPVESVVADGETSWIKRYPGHWDGTWVWDEADDSEIDEEIGRGAKVLRVGSGG